MIFYKNIKAFTLIELLVVIAIIAIVLLLGSSLDYNRLTTKQKLEIFTNSIKTDFESVRYYSLSGKGIGVDLNIPDKWEIDYSKSNSGTIITKSYSGSTENIIENKLFPLRFHISEINCLERDGTIKNTLADTQTGTIIFEGTNISLTGSCDTNSQILEVSVKYNTNTGTIQFNTLNGLVKTKNTVK